MTERKLDIFQTLAAADMKKYNWLDEQTPEAIKEFSPLVFLRWYSSVASNDDNALYMILYTNTLLNINFWEISKYPDLIYKLASSFGLKKKLRHEWIAMSNKKKKPNKIKDFMFELYPTYGEKEIDIMLSLMSKEEFLELLDDNGCSKEEIKEYAKSFDKC